MNAPTSIGRGDPVEIFRGWEREDRKGWRRKLLKVRNYAGVRAFSAQSSDAREALWHVQDIASRWAWSTASDDDLESVHKALVRFGNAAINLEELEIRHGD